MMIGKTKKKAITTASENMTAYRQATLHIVTPSYNGEEVNNP